MSGGKQPGGAAVHWLTAQSVLFGVMAALLGIAANAMFLDAYGSGWLPVTYIAIGVGGVAVSGTIARSAQRFDLIRIATAVLGGAAVLIGLAWMISAGGDGAWVSAPLLVLFPILIQLGFVFIGGQAGRILDIAGIKAGFARIMTGFPVGAVLGGMLAGPLVEALGRTEALLLATAIAQAAFAGLVWGTGRRYAALLAAEAGAAGGPGPGGGDATDGEHVRRSDLRRLFTRRFVLLILAYQVLSALGSQVSDFLVFDRATALFPSAEELARFFAGYTAAMNLVSIGFMFLLAGPLLRRYGLRLGIAANPLVVTVSAALMIVVLAVAGATSMALLAVVSATRIADIALSDGTTRTSINALYQVLPNRSRLAAQAAVEGMGVPVAIAASGVLILVLNALPAPLATMIVALAVVCAAWTWIALVLYRAYGPALVDALRHRRLLDRDATFEATVADAAIARHLLVSGDTRSARLGLELASTLDSPDLAPELAALAHDPRPDVRMAALAGLASSGDAASRALLAAEARAAAGSAEPASRLRAATVAGVLAAADREVLAGLLDDEVAAVRAAALESVRPGDRFAVEPAVRALGDARSAPAAMGAIGRLGDLAVPPLAAALASTDPAGGRLAARLVRAVTTPGEPRDEVLRRHVRHRDRELGRLVMERLAGPGPAPEAAGDPLDAALRDDAQHAARTLGAVVALAAASGGADGADGADGPLLRALDDHLALLRDRIVAGRTARLGRDRIVPVLGALVAGGSNAALAVEALEVAVGTAEAGLLGALLDRRLTPSERLERLAAAPGVTTARRDAEAWLRDIVEDADDAWRSSWLRACAIHAAAARGLLDRVDLTAARAAGDPVVDEELRLAATGPARPS